MMCHPLYFLFNILPFQYIIYTVSFIHPRIIYPHVMLTAASFPLMVRWSSEIRRHLVTDRSPVHHVAPFTHLHSGTIDLAHNLDLMIEIPHLSFSPPLCQLSVGGGWPRPLAPSCLPIGRIVTPKGWTVCGRSTVTRRSALNWISRCAYLLI